jgi:hypothetical protein
MKKKFSRLGMVGMVLAMMLVFGLMGCSGSSALAGKWQLVEGPTRGNPESIELLTDGTGILDGQGITWKTENGRFYMTHPLLAQSWSYTAAESTFTLTKDDGTILKYKKHTESPQSSEEFNVLTISP